TAEADEVLAGDGLRLGVAQQALFAMPPSQAGALHAAHGGSVAGERGAVALVDVDRSGPELFGDAASAGHVPRPHAGVEAVGGVVGAFDRLVLGREPVDGDDRSEGLLGAPRHGLLDAGEHGGLVEQRAEVGTGAASGQYGGALGAGLLHVLDDPVE